MNNKGETLVETLVSILIIVLVITGFSQVVASVAKSNVSIKNKRMNYDEAALNMSSDENPTGWYFNISNANEAGSEYNYNSTEEGASTYQFDITKINEFIDEENGYYHYEYKQN